MKESNQLFVFNKYGQKPFLPHIHINKRKDERNGPSFCLSYLGFFIRGFLNLQFSFLAEINLREVKIYLGLGYIQVGFIFVFNREWYKIRLNTLFKEN